MENILRKKKVTPATIAILNGRICIGLSDADLEMLGKAGKKVIKVRRL